MADTEKPVEKKSGTVYRVVFLVLLILLVMATFLTTSGPSLKAAKKAQTLNYIMQIVTACQYYQTEYDSMPETSENYRLKKILCGDNKHKIEFLSLKSKDVSPNGEMIDPWGTPFRIIFSSGTNVDVISAGPDKIFGTADDITNQ